MQTEVMKITEESLKLARRHLEQEELVAFPTETVYGLGAWAFSEKAIERIYQAKGRPSDNPLIVHIAPEFPLETLVKEIPPAVEPLRQHFWPGPLTLIMPKIESLSKRITGGLETVAVRMPSHPAAMALLKETGMPIAAPSANRSGRPSPTTARHVYEDMQGRIPLILDGGECEVGLESTVLDLTTPVPMILRPGAVTKEMLEKVLGEVVIDPAVLSAKEIAAEAVPRAPGMKYRHYAPKGHLIITDARAEQLAELIQNRQENERVGLIVTKQLAQELERILADRRVEMICLGDRNQPEELAANLFGALRAADEKNLTLIYGEALSKEGMGEAIMNRFLKASSEQLWMNKEEVQ